MSLTFAVQLRHSIQNRIFTLFCFPIFNITIGVVTRFVAFNVLHYKKHNLTWFKKKIKGLDTKINLLLSPKMKMFLSC